MDELENKVKGALYAFAIGDAMGATTEFLSKENVQRYYGTLKDIIGGGWLHLTRGQVTDDTQMMVCVYRGLLGRPVKKTDNDDYSTLNNIGQKFREGADANPPDIGDTCRAAIYSSPNTDFFDWTDANRRRQETYGMHDYGNGGVMRCLVPVLMGADLLALDQAYATHTNQFSQEYTEQYISALHDAFNGVKPDIQRGLREPTGYIVNTVYNAMEWFRATESIEAALIGAVNDGGDADTIAALTGGLAGSYYGYKNIPRRWIKQLDPRVRTELDEITRYIVNYHSHR